MANVQKEKFNFRHIAERMTMMNNKVLHVHVQKVIRSVHCSEIINTYMSILTP